MSPQTIAHYRITAKLGAGGMGEVWRATDTKLGRDVAIKVLPEAFAQDADRMARFTREAQVLASLNHPNIAAIYGVENLALVMELVEGPTLAERIARAPLPLDEALPVARQIADALEYAHDRGVIHRDLKPANIKVTPEGQVKVLDFGLAKALGNEPVSGNPASSPTLTMSPTVAGVILGTAAYMSPEQARGKPVDKRADIWAFGCVLYEMLTGKPAFAGETVSDILAAVIAREPRLDGLPAHLRPVIAKCLRQDARRRWRDIGDVRMALEEARPDASAAPERTRRRWKVAAGALALGLALGWIAAQRQPAADERALNFPIAPPPGESFALAPAGGSAISPDGRLLAFVATSGGVLKLWTRRLDSAAAHELPGTDGAQFPFWSPDSRSLGFFAVGKLKRVDLAGGPPFGLADATSGRGAAWSPTGAIIFLGQTLGGLYKVPATGGPATPLTTLDRAKGETTHRWPRFLPDGSRFLYFVRSSQPHVTGIYLGSLDRPREKTLLVESISSGAYCPPIGKRGAYLLWLRGDTLVAQTFDGRRAQLSGEPQPVPGAEAVSSNTGFNLADFSVAGDGTVLFGSGTNRYQLTWFSRDGRILSTAGKPDHYNSLRISPDAGRVAIATQDSSGDRDLWLLEFAREIQTRLTVGKGILMGVWSRDSTRTFYFAASGNTIFAKNASGGGAEEAFLQSQHILYANDVSPDGRFLIYEEFTEKGASQLWLVPLAGERKPIPYLSTPASKLNAQFSPDGRWIAYTSDEAGQQQIYVQSFPASENKWQVSSSGGNFPRWRRDGKELFYAALDGMLMAVSVEAQPQGLKFGTPARLFRMRTPIGPHAYMYDVDPGGQKILALAPIKGAGDAPPLTVLVNWQALLKP